MNIYEINRKIVSYNTKISERRTFIGKLNNLIDDATKTSSELKKTSENLKLGLTIDNSAPDNGALETYYNTIDDSISKLRGSLSIAERDIKEYQARINVLKAQRASLERSKNERINAEKA